jgi:hypothetical protein
MLSLIVNPSSGGGRAMRALPAVRAALGRQRFVYTYLRVMVPASKAAAVEPAP